MKPTHTRDTYRDGGSVMIERRQQIGPADWVYFVEVYALGGPRLYGETTAAALLALWHVIPRIIDVPPPPATVVQVELLPVQPRRSRKQVVTGEAAEVAAIRERMTRGQR